MSLSFKGKTFNLGKTTSKFIFATSNVGRYSKVFGLKNTEN